MPETVDEIDEVQHHSETCPRQRHACLRCIVEKPSSVNPVLNSREREDAVPDRFALREQHVERYERRLKLGVWIDNIAARSAARQDEELTLRSQAPHVRGR